MHTERTRYFADACVVLLILVFVIVVYGVRIESQPLVGEETRWGSAAREMLETSDWIVPRQQGRAFPERPPMTIWAIAAVGWARGQVDTIAIRLPSILAVGATCLILYAYARLLISRFAGTAAAFVYASFGQVLQIGRMGESEALFTLFLSASLLLWHLGYLRAWHMLANWLLGFSLAACAALVKGPQAPVYFIAVTAAYLAFQRRWRDLLSWQYLAGLASFMLIIAAWLAPFYMATGLDAVVATWSGLAADRIQLGGLVNHLVTYPLETFVCLLPWSPLLVALVHRETRARLDGLNHVVPYLILAILVTYPTVWFAAEARGRYFMPLYPLLAVLVAILIERCAVAPLGTYPQRAWRQFTMLWSSILALAGIVLIAFTLLPRMTKLQELLPHAASLVVGLLLSAGACWIWYFRSRLLPRARLAIVLCLAMLAGASYCGLVIEINCARWHNPSDVVAKLRNAIPPGTRLVSLTPIEHRFAYYYGEPITELEWPSDLDDLPANVEYFCFMRNPGDTAERRIAGRGRSWTITSGTLPFAWQELDSICVERRVDDDERTVVLGRVMRPLRGFANDATVPQDSLTQRTASREPGINPVMSSSELAHAASSTTATSR